MSSNLYVGDAIAVLKLGFELYEKGKEAFNATDDFRELLEDLRLIKRALFPVAARVRQPIDRHDPNGDTIIAQALERCRDAFLSFQPIVEKYRNLANTYSGSWSQRVSWVKDQGELRKCHDRFEKAVRQLHFVHSAFGPHHAQSSQGSFPSPRVEDEASPQIARSSGLSGITYDCSSPHGSNSTLRRKPVGQSASNSTSLQAESQQSGTQYKFYSAADFGIGNQESSPFWYIRASEDAPLPSHVFNPIAFSKDNPHSVPLKSSRRKAVLGASLRMRLVEESRFMASKASADICICHATWWLLKCKAWRRALQNVRSQHAENKRDCSIWTSSVSRPQAIADLYKSSFILENLVLARDPYGTNMDDTEWIRLVTLANYIDEELREIETDPSAQAIDEDLILTQDLSVSENWMSPAEDPKRVPEFIDNLRSPRRWIKAEMTDSGIRRGQSSDRKERVLFHNFVDAQLGDEQISMKSHTSPYLLILSYQTGRSEMFLSLCNLAFTINLSKVLTWRDLPGLKESTRPDGGLEFEFTSQSAVFRFLSHQDHAEFLKHPEKFFDVVKDREPKPGEMMVFRDTIESYQSHDEATGSDIFSKYRQMGDAFATPSKSCEISIYDHCPEQSWKTTRRLVLSSDPSTTEPWCVSHWLPLSNVRVETMSSKQVVLKWSDYYHLDERPNGEYGVWYSCLYRPERPNCSVTLNFRDDESARSLIDAILRPFDTSFKLRYIDLLCTVRSNPTAEPFQLYRLRDLGIDSEVGEYGRLVVSVIRNHPNNTYVTEMFFIHRDVDFESEFDSNYHIWFPELHAPDYHTSIRDVAKRPEDDYEEPKLEDVSTTTDSLRLDFPSRQELIVFIDNMTGWVLEYCRPVRIVSLDHKWPFLSDSHHDAVVHVFETISLEDPRLRRQRLAVRSLSEEKAICWLTADVVGPHRSRGRVLFKNLTVDRGDELDTIEMRAVDSSARAEQQSRLEKGLSIVFQKSGDLNDFMGTVKLKAEENFV